MQSPAFAHVVAVIGTPLCETDVISGFFGTKAWITTVITFLFQFPKNFSSS